MKLNLVKPNKENLNTFVAIGSALILVGFFDFLTNTFLDFNFTGFLPELEGDKCTFIGSTFLTLGETEPHYNNMIVFRAIHYKIEVYVNVFVFVTPKR